VTILGEITRRAVLALTLRVKCHGFYSYAGSMVPEHTSSWRSPYTRIGPMRAMGPMASYPAAEREHLAGDKLPAVDEACEVGQRFRAGLRWA
jgi:hypothetical protein